MSTPKGLKTLPQMPWVGSVEKDGVRQWFKRNREGDWNVFTNSDMDFYIDTYPKIFTEKSAKWTHNK